MQFGDNDYPIEQFILIIILILSIIFTTLLFFRGRSSYSVKYQLMRKHRFFRINQCFTYIIQGIYKLFFILPVLLIITIAILRGTKKWEDIISIIINGFVILTVIYPIKNQFFYYKLIAGWILVIAQQISTLFLYLQEKQELYMELSVIFYSINFILFSLAILANENVYWEISQAIAKIPQQIKSVNEKWGQSINNIPKIFNGGLYGAMCKSPISSYILFIILYLSSLVVLGVYAFLVYLVDNSYLGVIGLISNIVYDIFVIAFSSLKEKQRSIRSIFLVIFFGRLMSFIFGSQLWLIGYCVLYLGIGIFIGSLIVNRRFPMKFQSTKKQQHININALKTPQFVLLLLTVQIIALIGASYGLNLSPVVQYNNQKQLPLWQIALIAVFTTWVIIAYLFSMRVLQRHMAKITSAINYFFGLQFVNQYHIYLAITYTMIIGIGLYWQLYLQDAIILIGCIFLPLIYMTILTIFVNWVKNEYQILADIEDYNKRAKKKHAIKIKKQEIMMKRQLKIARNKEKRSSLKRMNKLFDSYANPKKDQQNNIIQIKNKQSEINGDNIVLGTQSKIINQEKSNAMINISKQKAYLDNQEQLNQEMGQFQSKIQPFQELINWKDPSNNVQLKDIWSCLTTNDKKVIISFLILLLLLIGFSVTGYLWGQHTAGLGISLSLICYLTMLSYYRCAKCGNQILVGELIGAAIGYILGLVYWSILYFYIWGPLIWAVFYLILSGVMIGIGIQKKLDIKIIVSLAIKIVLTLTFICVILGVSFEPEVVILTATIIVLIAFALIAVYFRIKQDNIPRWVSILIGSIVVVGVVTISALGFAFDKVSDLAVFTIIVGLIQLSLLIISLIIYIQKNNNKFDVPHVYSAYGYPIYRFQSAKQQLKSSTNHMVIFNIAMIVLIIYSGLIAVLFKQKYFAIYAGGIFLCVQFFIIISAVISSYYSIGMRRRYLTDQIIKQSYKIMTQKYMLDQTEGQDSPYYFQKLQQNRKKIQENDYDSQQKLDQLWKNVVYYHDLWIKNQQQQEKFLFYWMVMIDYYLNAKKRQHIITSLNMLKEIQEQLLQDGIFLQQLNQANRPQIKYKKLMKQIQSLPPLDYIILQETLQNHKQQKKKKKSQLNQLSKKEDQKNNDRDNQLFKKLNQNKGNKNQSIQKFNQLIKDLGRKGLFTDQEFPPNQTSLGQLLEAKVDGWRRPNVQQTFIKQGIDAGDVKQGDIGDCYLISSFGVLGQKRVKQALGWNGDNQQWQNTKGAYMVRFFKFLKEVFVIIDDQMPVNVQQQWVFAKSQDPMEFWPGILQKAYAKLYSGYGNIVQGKCHRVLAEFTGGFPFQIVLQSYKNNPNGLWSKLISGSQNGYLLAGGSPFNPEGDLAVSKRGIVQGHAYSILDVKQVQGHKVLKLKNPHGSAGKEWIGDFSDKSDLMTKRMMGLLGHQLKDDGIFWMTLEDFIYQFKSLYICSVFDEKIWKKLKPIEGAWTLENSFGTPNLSEDTYKNPQYGIKVSKKSIVFVNLTQTPKTALLGQNYIYLRIQRNDGKRMHKQDISSSKLCGIPLRPINAVSLSAEIELQSDNYPYTFTLLVCTKNQGQTGKYTLQMFCSDFTAQIIDDKDFDR